MPSCIFPALLCLKARLSSRWKSPKGTARSAMASRMQFPSPGVQPHEKLTKETAQFANGDKMHSSPNKLPQPPEARHESNTGAALDGNTFPSHVSDLSRGLPSDHLFQDFSGFGAAAPDGNTFLPTPASGLYLDRQLEGNDMSNDNAVLETPKFVNIRLTAHGALCTDVSGFANAGPGNSSLSAPPEFEIPAAPSDSLSTNEIETPEERDENTATAHDPLSTDFSGYPVGNFMPTLPIKYGKGSTKLSPIRERPDLWFEYLPDTEFSEFSSEELSDDSSIALSEFENLASALSSSLSAEIKTPAGCNGDATAAHDPLSTGFSDVGDMGLDDTTSIALSGIDTPAGGSEDAIPIGSPSSEIEIEFARGNKSTSATENSGHSIDISVNEDGSVAYDTLSTDFSEIEDAVITEIDDGSTDFSGYPVGNFTPTLPFRYGNGTTKLSPISENADPFASFSEFGSAGLEDDISFISLSIEIESAGNNGNGVTTASDGHPIDLATDEAAAATENNSQFIKIPIDEDAVTAENSDSDFSDSEDGAVTEIEDGPTDFSVYPVGNFTPTLPFIYGNGNTKLSPIDEHADLFAGFSKYSSAGPEDDISSFALSIDVESAEGNKDYAKTENDGPSVGCSDDENAAMTADYYDYPGFSCSEDAASTVSEGHSAYFSANEDAASIESDGQFTFFSAHEDAGSTASDGCSINSCNGNAATALSYLTDSPGFVVGNVTSTLPIQHDNSKFSPIRELTGVEKSAQSTGHASTTTNDVFGDFSYFPVGIYTPTEPIRYGNGTRLSPIKELAETNSPIGVGESNDVNPVEENSDNSKIRPESTNGRPFGLYFTDALFKMAEGLLAMATDKLMNMEQNLRRAQNWPAPPLAANSDRATLSPVSDGSNASAWDEVPEPTSLDTSRDTMEKNDASIVGEH